MLAVYALQLQGVEKRGASMSDRKKGTVRIRCPHCKRETHLKVDAPAGEDFAFYSPRWIAKLHPDIESPNTSGDSAYTVDGLYYCPETDCAGPIYLFMKWSLNKILLPIFERGGWHRTSTGPTFQIVEMFPSGSKAELDPAVPSSIRAEWPGIIELAEQRKSPAVVTMGCRAVLESAIKELEKSSANVEGKSKKRDTLQDKIDNLSKDGIITHTLKDWAHELRLDGNDGAHDLKGDADRALTFARFVEFFLEATFVMQAKLHQVRRAPVEAGDAFEQLLGAE